MKVSQWCPTLCDPIYYTVHGILQARILEWVAFPLSRGFSLTRDRTQVSHNAGRFFTSWPTRKALSSLTLELIWVCHIMLMHSFQSQFCHSSFFFFFLDLYWFYKSQHKSTFSQVSSYPPPLPLFPSPLVSLTSLEKEQTPRDHVCTFLSIPCTKTQVCWNAVSPPCTCAVGWFYAVIFRQLEKWFVSLASKTT